MLPLVWRFAQSIRQFAIAFAGGYLSFERIKNMLRHFLPKSQSVIPLATNRSQRRNSLEFCRLFLQIGAGAVTGALETLSYSDLRKRTGLLTKP
jgi:hypothetical protein